MKTLQLKKPKLTTTFLTLFLIATIITSCEKPPKQDKNRITKEDVQAMKDNHIIDLKDAVKAYDKYTKQRVKILKDTLKKKYGDDFSDTRNVWIDLTDIKAYIKYVEDNSPDAEGFSFYFSVNSDNGGKEKNHQTFFIAPTVKNVMNGDTIQSGYTVKDGQRVFIYEAVKEYLKGQEQNIQKASFFSLLQDEGGYLFNKHGDSPPNDNN